MSWREEAEHYALTEYLGSEDLVRLVSGSELRGHEDIWRLSRLGLGRWFGGHLDRWQWDRGELKKCKIADLASIYLALKHAGELPDSVQKWNGKVWVDVP